MTRSGTAAANLGLFSFAAAVAAGPSGRVLAVEPDTVLGGLLRRSAAVNHGQPWSCAGGRAARRGVRSGVGGRFHIARRSRSTNHLDGFGTTQTGGMRSTQLVPAVTLDWLADRYTPPDVMKIDVEASVLAGGPRVLGLTSTIICVVAARNPRPYGTSSPGKASPCTGLRTLDIGQEIMQGRNGV